MQNWRARKISHESAKHDLIMSRDSGVIRACALIDFIIAREQAMQQQTVYRQRLRNLEASLGAFVDCPEFHTFWAQFHDIETSVRFRFRPLLFLGASREGKTQRASAFKGMLYTLVVNCQGLKESLPNLLEFTKESYHCIVFDEVKESQVLNNKLVFQSGPKPVTLGQSPCGAHRYTRDLYGVPMILCSNDFKLTLADGLSSEDVEWLNKNLVIARLPEGSQTWFVQ